MGRQAFQNEPLPGDGGPVGVGPASEDDIDEHLEWLVREIEAGRLLPPPESAIEGPAVSVSLGDACDVDPELLAAVCGPDGLGGQAAGAAFGQGKAADVLRPGPVLAALTAQAVSRLTLQPGGQPGRQAGSPPGQQPTCQPGSLTDDELVGALQATRRLANLVSWQQTVVIAEFARRRQAEFEAAKTAGKPVGCRDGEFPGEELAMELVDTGPYTSARIDTAIELVTRLPRTLAGMKDGTIDLGRACTIASRTRVMTDRDAARADEVLAAAAPGLRPDQMARKAAALELKLAPEAVAARKKLARQLDQRVEARREESGNASLAGRELDTAEVIASKAHIDAVALKLRNSGLFGGPIGRLRALVLTDLTQGRNPLDRIAARPIQIPEAASPAPETDSSPAGQVDDPAGSGQPPERAADPADGNATPGASLRGIPIRSDPAPLPALINLLVPAGTLLGWDTAPGQVAGWGLLDADEIRALVQAAAKHPRTRWCFTLTAPDGTAIAHSCAAGRHPWKPPDPDRRQIEQRRQTGRRPGGVPTPGQAARLADLLRGFNLTFEPIARDTCDHRHAEDRYVPSRKLKHLLRARNQTCTAPACNAQAIYCDIDHSIPYPDGPTDECNTNPKCRRHHRTKQAPGWKTTQCTPDTTTWTTPSGRTHTTGPTAYNL